MVGVIERGWRRLIGWCLQGDGRCVHKCEWAREVWAENRKPSCLGSILHAMLEMSAGGSGGRWISGAYEVTAAVGWWVRKREVGEGLGAENSKASRRGSISGMLSKKRQWVMVVGSGVAHMRWWS
jgi:hypothetical protein